jgi:purine-binding chemotaxis protein CheW
MPEVPIGPGQRILDQVRRAQQNQTRTDDSDGPRDQYLSFRLDQDWFALRVDRLVEVLPLPKLTRVPSVPDHILGVINLRGEVLSAVDLKRFFGLLQGAAEEPAVVVVEHAQVRTGLVVDAIGDLISLSHDDLVEQPLLVGRSQREFFEGAARCDDTLVSIVNLEALLRAEGMYFDQG